MAQNFQERLAHAFLVWFGFTAVLSLMPAYLAFSNWQTAHWLNTDGVATKANVDAFDGLNLKYSYTVNQSTYGGTVKFHRQLEPGEKLDVFVSSSHPWISSLAKPALNFEGGGYLGVVMGVSVLVLIPIVANFRNEE